MRDIPVGAKGTYSLKVMPAHLAKPILFSCLAMALLGNLIFFDTAFAQGRNEPLDKLLSEWITNNIHFKKDREGRETLFIRKRPVRAYVKSDDPEIVALARSEIGNLADAFGLDHTFTDTRINMFIATAEGISDGDKPNRDVLKNLGLPDSAVERIVTDSDNWSTGCGLYDSRDDEGRLTVSIVIGDTALPRAKLQSCIASGIVFSFGLNTGAKEVFANRNEYVQFLLLGRAVSDCEKNVGSQISNHIKPNREIYTNCILNKLKVKLSE